MFWIGMSLEHFRRFAFYASFCNCQFTFKIFNTVEYPSQNVTESRNKSAHFSSLLAVCQYVCVETHINEVSRATKGTHCWLQWVLVLRLIDDMYLMFQQASVSFKNLCLRIHWNAKLISVVILLECRMYKKTTLNVWLSKRNRNK